MVNYNTILIKRGVYDSGDLLQGWKNCENA